MHNITILERQPEFVNGSSDVRGKDALYGHETAPVAR
jgi:hypothetical protein